jgi:hypothetical protein
MCKYPGALANKLSFLTNYGVTFEMWLENIHADIWIIPWILIAFIIVLFFRNSNEQLANLE